MLGKSLDLGGPTGWVPERWGMDGDIDDMTGVERPRTRRLVSVVAVVVPVIVLAGASAWFIRAYVMPPMIKIPEAAMAAPQDASAAGPPDAPTAFATAAAEPETTGTSPPAAPEPAAPAVRYTTDTAAIWASVPLPGPPRSGWNSPAEPAAVTGAPIAGPVPLPPQRPRISAAANPRAVPLPRPRPSLASN